MYRTLLILAGSAACFAADGGKLVLHQRSRIPVEGRIGDVRVVMRPVEWEPNRTAIIVCDMWDQHWCAGATRRVAELAPAMNEVVKTARDRGVFIIHAPSGTVGFYEDHPARRRARDVAKTENLPRDIAQWCRWISDEEEQTGYPIDHSDGGCDCEPTCKQGSPWRRQIETIEIADANAISDSGPEVWSLLEARGIGNVILMGVHTNMCVLGRPFGLRNMARYGRNVVLMRDMTDTMYNSRARPFVSHFTGTDLVVEHVERFVCPTITSTVLTGRPAFVFKDDKRARVVILSAESEYKAVETMPVLARRLQTECGFSCEVLQGSTGEDDGDLNYVSGMEALARADVAIIFARRRGLPADQMECLRQYLRRGGGLIGLRTASHAFDTRGRTPQGHADWPRFDPEVLGGNYHGHHGAGPKTQVTAADGAAGHPILEGVDLPFESVASLYKTGPLEKNTQALLNGKIDGQATEPLAWTNQYGDSRIFYASLGHVDDFKCPAFHRMLVNAIHWVMAQEPPETP